jgi:hypothetical protein
LRYVSQLAPRNGSDNPRKEPGPAHVFTPANTRIQMHQNLFTLTKNKIRPSTIKLGANIQFFAVQTFAGIEAQKIETRFSP